MSTLSFRVRFSATPVQWRRGGVYGLSFLCLAALGSSGPDAGMLWAATASIWTCLADPGGTARDRLLAIGSVGLGGAGASAIGASIASVPWLALPAVLVAGLVAGMVEARGAAPALCGKLLFVVLVAACLQTAAGGPGALTAWPLAAHYAVGGGVACLLSLALIPSARDHSPRAEIVALFDSLHALALLLHTAEGDNGAATAAAKRRTRECIEQARSVLQARRGLFDAVMLLHCRYLVGLGDAVFALLIVASELRQRLGPDRLPLRHLARCIGELRGQAGEGLGGHRPDLPALTRSMHLQLKRLTAPIANAEAPPIYQAALAALARFPEFAAWRTTFQWPRRSLLLTLGESGRALAEHLGRDARVMRHALRLAIAGALSLLPAMLWPFDHGYWVAITVIMVLSPQLQTTRRITLQRLAGSIAGAMLGCLLGLAHPAPWLALGISAACLAVAYAARLAGNPGVFASMLTPAVILFCWIGEPASDSSHFAVLRGVDTALGCLIALASYLLLAQRAELSRTRRATRRAVAVNAVYLRAALAQAMAPQPDAEAESRLEAFRIAAGRASVHAERALEQAMPDLDAAIAEEFSRMHVTVRAVAALAGVVRVHASAPKALVPDPVWMREQLAQLHDELATLAARPGAPMIEALAPDPVRVSGREHDGFLAEQIAIARSHIVALHAQTARMEMLLPKASGRRWRLSRSV